VVFSFLVITITPSSFERVLLLDRAPGWERRRRGMAPMRERKHRSRHTCSWLRRWADKAAREVTEKARATFLAAS
jgi:hypothetical protein